MTIKRTLKQQIEEKLFKNIVSLITIGFTDQDLQPLSIDEQKHFFTLSEVKEHIIKIIEDIEQWMIEDNIKTMPPNDAFFESIYEPNGLYDTIIAKIEQTRKQIDSDNYKYDDNDFLKYEEYKYNIINCY